MSILDKKALKFLEDYLNNAAPTGYESGGQKIWMNYLKPYVDEFITDVYGTAVGVINPEAKYKVVIEGHSDEISWYVNYITDNGLIYVIRNGGSDHQIAPSKWVNIQTKKGIICYGDTNSYWKNIPWQFHNYPFSEEVGFSCYLSVRIFTFVFFGSLF